MSHGTAEIERLAREAPAGPWELETRAVNATWIKGASGEVVARSYGDDNEIADKTAAYIAAVSPDIVLGLIADIKLAQEARDEWRARAEKAERFLNDGR